MLTQKELDHGFKEEMQVNNLYEEFIHPEVIGNQISWTKWHIMDRQGVDYKVAAKVLNMAVRKGKLLPEDYYHRFVVIK